MRVGGTFPYTKRESHLDLGDGVAEIREAQKRGRRKAPRNFVSGTM